MFKDSHFDIIKSMLTVKSTKKFDKFKNVNETQFSNIEIINFVYFVLKLETLTLLNE